MGCCIKYIYSGANLIIKYPIIFIVSYRKRLGFRNICLIIYPTFLILLYRMLWFIIGNEDGDQTFHSSFMYCGRPLRVAGYDRFFRTSWNLEHLKFNNLIFSVPEKKIESVAVSRLFVMSVVRFTHAKYCKKMVFHFPFLPCLDNCFGDDYSIPEQ